MPRDPSASYLLEDPLLSVAHLGLVALPKVRSAATCEAALPHFGAYQKPIAVVIEDPSMDEQLAETRTRKGPEPQSPKPLKLEEPPYRSLPRTRRPKP